MVKKKVFQFIKGNSQQQFNRWRVREKGEEKNKDQEKKECVPSSLSPLSLSTIKAQPKRREQKGRRKNRRRRKSQQVSESGRGIKKGVKSAAGNQS
jgi:hypothetical protein